MNAQTCELSKKLPANVVSFWDHHAKNYFENIVDEPRPYEPQLLDEIFGRLKRPAQVLDLGCGFGRLATELKDYPQRFPLRGYTGIDCSEKMLALAREHHPELDFRAGCMEDIAQIVTEPYDLFFALTSFGFMSRDSVPDVLKQLRQIIAPDGLGLLFLDHGNRDEIFESDVGEIVCCQWQQGTIRDLCSQAGFETIDVFQPCNCHFYLVVGPKD